MNFHVEIEQNKIKLKKYLLERNIYNLNIKKYENLKIFNEIKTNITDILNKEESDLIYETNDDDLNEKDFNYLINLVTGKENKSTFIVIDLGTSSLKSGDSNHPTPFITINSRLKLIHVIEKKNEKKKENKSMFSREMNQCCEEKILSRDQPLLPLEDEKECCDEEDEGENNDEILKKVEEKVEKVEEKKEKKQLKTTKAKIKIKEWTPDVQYIKDISEKKDIDSKYKKYLEIR
jgi:hypothetical protein